MSFIYLFENAVLMFYVFLIHLLWMAPENIATANWKILVKGRQNFLTTCLWSVPFLLFTCNKKDFLTTYVTIVNSEIFARVLFSRNFAYAKFCENKILTE